MTTSTTEHSTPPPTRSADHPTPPGEPVAEPDARLVGLVVALVPAPAGEVQPTEEQKKLAAELSKLVEAAQKKRAEQQKAPDEGELKEATAKFFSGDIAAAEAQKKAEAQAQPKPAAQPGVK